MKQLIFILFLSLMCTFAFAYAEEGKEKKKENSAGFCPVTNIKGDIDDCLKCHTKGNFEIKEIPMFEKLDLPYETRFALENGKPVIVYDLDGPISGYIGSKFDKKIEYFYQNHPDIKKIRIIIHSGGGSLFGGYQMVGVMKHWISKGYEIETRVHGFAASAAFFIFCGGNSRLVSPQAELMWHELITFSMFDVSGPSDKEDQAKVLRHLQDTANLMLAEISKLTKGEIDKLIRKKEYWIRGPQAVKVGLATGLLN